MGLYLRLVVVCCAREPISRPRARFENSFSGASCRRGAQVTARLIVGQHSAAAALLSSPLALYMATGPPFGDARGCIW